METEDSFKLSVNAVRSSIKGVAADTKLVKDSLSDIALAPGEDRGEVIANLMLAYRHLEDASMRLGKVLQARDGGVSVYDKATTVGA